MLTSSQACAACPVRQLGVCRLLNVAEITRLKQIALRRQVAAGETIMSEGDAPYYFAIIVSGVVKLIKTLPGGVRQPVGFLFPSDFIGRPLAAASPFSAVAVTDVELCSYRRSQFENLFQVHPEIEHCLFSHVLNVLDSARDWMLLLAQKTAAEKVASLLLLFARRGGQESGRTDLGAAAIQFELPLSRADIAACLGLRGETVSRQIALLKAQGIIRPEGRHKIVVPMLERLRARAEREHL